MFVSNLLRQTNMLYINEGHGCIRWSPEPALAAEHVHGQTFEDVHDADQQALTGITFWCDEIRITRRMSVTIAFVKLVIIHRTVTCAAVVLLP